MPRPPGPPQSDGNVPSTLQLAKELRSTGDKLQRHQETQLHEFHELLGLMHQQLSQLDIALSFQDSSQTLLEPHAQKTLKGIQAEASRQAANSATPGPTQSVSAAPSVERAPAPGKVNVKDLKAVSARVSEAFENGAHIINGRQVTDIESLFKALDKDGAGTLTKYDIVEGLKQVGVNLSNRDVEVLLSALDKDCNGLIEPREFKEAINAYDMINEDLVKTASALSLGSESVLDKLKSSLELSESVGEPTLVKGKSMVFASKEKKWKKQEKDTALDLIMAAVILANAVSIGISMDYTSPALQVADLLFTFSFLGELIAKFWIHGIRKHFSSALNCLDFLLISADLIQLLLTFADPLALGGAPSASLFRVMRLVRLARLLRILRLDMFDDLISMVGGMLGGMSTLGWAVVLFLLIVYVTSLLFREFFGNTTKMETALDVDLRELFSSLPRSMLTVFRCFFGDCSTMDGASLFEMIQIAYGAPHTLLISAVFFFVVVGLFNVISAIFVESTIAAAQALQKARKSERENDFQLWSTRVAVLVRLLYEYNGTEVGPTLSSHLAELATVPVSESTFKEWLKDERVIWALSDLEILAEDHKYLFDILDSDNTGAILISQLVDGLQRLRGDPRRSDIITVDLMLRAIQSQTTLLVAGMDNALDRLGMIVQATKQT